MRGIELPLHTLRTRELALALGETMGLDQFDLLLLREAAGLHDIGKALVPSEILAKPDGLDDDEWTRMRAHAQEGALMVHRIARVVGAHHERYDGNGYPKGLAGEQIPLLARILHLADALDAMLADRVYRQRLTVIEALAQARNGRGSDFDPACVDALEYLVGSRYLAAL